MTNDTIEFRVDARVPPRVAWIDKTGFHVDPSIPADEVAQTVMDALTAQIQYVVDAAIREDRLSRNCQ